MSEPEHHTLIIEPPLEFWKQRAARLERELHEARAIIRAGTDEIAEYYERLMDAKVGTAEQRGYRRGVEDAARVSDIWVPSNATAPEDYHIGAGVAAAEISAAILALLEQTSDTNSPHPEIGAGRSAKRE